MMKTIAFVAGVLTVLAAAWWGLEMLLVAASRYRLRHGDGRERSFRRPSAR